MAFKKQEQVIRNPHIRSIEIRLIRTIGESDEGYPQGALYSLTIDDQFNNPMGHRGGDLMSHLTNAQKNALISFMDAMWAKAEAEVIG